MWDDLGTLAALGVLAKSDSMLATQVVDTDIFTSLAMVVSVDSPLSAGQPFCGLRWMRAKGATSAPSDLRG